MLDQLGDKSPSGPSRPKKRTRKRPVRITQAEALRRLTLMSRQIETDILDLIRCEAAFEEGSRILMRVSEPAQGYSVSFIILQSLLRDLILALSRLFDQGARRFHPNKSDLASIPLAARLLDQKRCEQGLRRTAQERPREPERNEHRCLEATRRAVCTYRTLAREESGRRALKRMRDLRNFVAAHSMFETKALSLPLWGDLTEPAAVAKKFAHDLALAVRGAALDLGEVEARHRTEARAFWTGAFGTSCPADAQGQ